MISINQKIKDRYIKGMRKYKKLLEKARDADINDISGMEKIVEKALGYVDLTIKNLQEAR